MLGASDNSLQLSMYSFIKGFWTHPGKIIDELNAYLTNKRIYTWEKVKIELMWSNSYLQD